MGKLLSIKISDAQSENYPHVCMHCVDKPASYRENVQMSYFLPLWARSLILLGSCLFGIFPVNILFGVIIYFVCGLLLRKKQRVNLYFCELCHKKWKRIPIYTILSFVLIFISFFLLIYSILIIPLIVFIYYMYWRKWTVIATSINKEEIIIRIPNDRYPILYAEYLKRVKHKLYE